MQLFWYLYVHSVQDSTPMPIFDRFRFSFVFLALPAYRSTKLTQTLTLTQSNKGFRWSACAISHLILFTRLGFYFAFFLSPPAECISLAILPYPTYLQLKILCLKRKCSRHCYDFISWPVLHLGLSLNLREMHTRSTPALSTASTIDCSDEPATPSTQTDVLLSTHHSTLWLSVVAILKTVTASLINRQVLMWKNYTV